MKKLILIILSLLTISIKSQNVDPKTVDNYIYLTEYWSTVSPTKEATYSKYVESNHGMNQNFTTWKQNNKFLYIKEIWYYTESFYVKRNFYSDGSVSIDGTLNTFSIDETQIDISRFEYQRKESEESIVTIPGYKDVIILLPNNKLIYKP